MRNTIAAAWAFAVLALISMVSGHMGKHELSWISNQISTFAAKGPNDAWITASMFLSAGALICISILISRYGVLGDSYAVHIFPIIIGAAVSGLILLALFEETAPTTKLLDNSTLSAIRQQHFHDAGLLVFFYCTECLVILAGLFCAITRRSWWKKITGVVITCLGPVSFYLMIAPWPSLIGVTGPCSGLKQRASFLCIWISMILFLSLASCGCANTDER